MTHVISVTNQKGGVGKTTSCVSLSAELALMGKRILLIDLDPQASASSGLSIDLLPAGEDLYDVFFGRIPIRQVIRPSKIDRLYVVPSSKDLIGIEIELGKAPGRELILKSELAQVKKLYDYIIIDCPPSSGLLTLNAIGASDYIIIPLQAEYYALEGLSALMGTVQFVKQTFNQKLEILGVFLTMFDARTNLSNQVQAEARSYFKEVMFHSVIPRNIKLSESPSHGVPISLYDSESAGAKAYHQLAVELEERCEGAISRPVAANE
ncbi:MAG: ParA family protein [Deltaproteobacteria bacterium]|nr:ParA family protein [Deltaproteobacteria bacterium]